MKFNTEQTISKGIVNIKTKKDKIILTNTNAALDDHFIKLKTRMNGSYDRSPTFTISLTGVIYQHFDPVYYTNLMHDEKIDRSAITIALENVGYLIKNDADNTYYDWRGVRYCGRVFEKSWRTKRYWAKYSSRQINSLINLIDYLCMEYGIDENFIGNNVSIHKPELFKGILNRSNFYSYRYDLSPAMDFNSLAEQINNHKNDKDDKE